MRRAHVVADAENVPVALSRPLDGPGKAFVRRAAAVHASIRNVAVNSRFGLLKSSHSTIIWLDRKLRRIRGERQLDRAMNVAHEPCWFVLTGTNDRAERTEENEGGWK